VFGTGEIVISSRIEVGRIGLPDLPKMGLTLSLPEALGSVEWWGRGPHESYRDRKRGARVGHHASQVGALGHPYIRPQESGNLTDVRWIALAAPDGVGLLAVADSTMEASALLNEDRDFDEGPAKQFRHGWDVIPRDRVTLDLDHGQMGVGGDTSWGARPHPEYTLPAGPYSYRVRLVPFGPGSGSVEALARQKW
jgi:beta-galactosidase